MLKIFKLVFIFYIIYTCPNSIVNKDYIKNFINQEAPFNVFHGAKDDFLGGGLIYYSIIYAKKSNVCVCLGSGGGFVPRIMWQAQKDSNVPDFKTILIDGNMGDWGRPNWLPENSFFRKNFPDIEIIIDTTENAAKKLSNSGIKIDYLHIDADHSEEGAWKDFCNYLPLMSKDGVITIHDTGGGLPCARIIPRIRAQGYSIVNFDKIGEGFAILYLGENKKSKV